MRIKLQLLITVFLLLFGIAGCREDNSKQKHDSTISLSGGGKTSIQVNDVELRVENGQLFLNEQVFDIPNSSTKIVVNTRGGNILVSLDGKQVYKGAY